MLALRAHNLRHRFASTLALDGVSLEVGAGELVALVGQSGSGKTTLLRSFNRMVEPSEGAVFAGDRDVRTMPVTALRRQLGYVPQNGGLLPHWTVLRNVALVPTLLARPDATALATAALELVGLPAALRARFPRELSGGQRQRAALARALAAEQQAVLLDEPFGALDAISRAELHETFGALRQQRRFTAVLVTHDLGEAARLATRIVVMKDGRVEQSGTLAELRARPTPYVERLLEHAVASGRALS
jgi:osmoprotectant transport system ATP-binding protein